MKKNALYLFIVLAVAIGACKNNTSKTGTENDAEAEKAAQAAAEQRRQNEEKCKETVKAFVLKLSEEKGLTFDTLIVASVDSATEKTARKTHCQSIVNNINLLEKNIKLLEEVIKAEMAIHPSMAASSKAEIKLYREQLKVKQGQLEVCQEYLKSADDTKYIYYKVNADAIGTNSREKKDTMRGPYFVDKDFKIKEY